MKRPKITPGQWSYGEEDEEGHFVIESIQPNKHDCCVCYGAGWYEEGRNDGPANAKAIAALPLLLDALEKICKNFESLYSGDNREHLEYQGSYVEAKKALLAAGYTE
jgi:hypothetical protein